MTPAHTIKQEDSPRQEHTSPHLHRQAASFPLSCRQMKRHNLQHPTMMSSFTSFNTTEETTIQRSARLVGNNGLTFPARRNTKQNNARKALVHPASPSEHGRWTWHVASVRPVPLYHPVEQAAIVIQNVPLQVISERISHFMRVNSICCSYHDTRVDCLTMGLVKFTIYLWKAPEGGIMVELQRRQGCAIETQRIRHGLAQAVTTGDEVVVSWERKHVSEATCRAFQEQCGGGAPMTTTSCDALGITMHLLQSSHTDQNQLGMESLAALTNPEIVHVGNAKTVCRALISGQGPNGECLQDSLLPFFLNTQRDNESDDDLMYDSDDEDEQEYAQGCHFGEMHHRALLVLEKALQVESKSPSPHVDIQSNFWQSILQSLIYDLEQAKHRPREAAMSAKCLNLLAELTPEIYPVIGDERIVPVLIEANEYGKACHLSLERESQKLMTSLAVAS